MLQVVRQSRNSLLLNSEVSLGLALHHEFSRNGFLHMNLFRDIHDDLP